MIYGYAKEALNEQGLLEMKEVTFAAPPDVLREVARFLQQMAKLMEEGGFAICSHRHIGNTIDGWNRRFPDKDLIVMPPDDGSYPRETRIVIPGQS
jgi:hypothetical protein